MRSSSLTPLRIGMGGPVGSGKTALLDRLCKAMRDNFNIAAITNDIYTREDAEFLTRSGALTADRIMGVETGGCPHTAIREDASMNLAAIDDLCVSHPGLDLILVESGGDNLASTFSLDLVDYWLFVIDVAGGDDIPRKRGPGVTQCDLLIINKVDLAPYVDVDIERMVREAGHVRDGKPVLLTNCATGEGVEAVVGRLCHDVLLQDAVA